VAGDEVTQADGLKVFVAQELKAPLADTTIDVTGDNGVQRLVFRPTDEAPPTS
jgi:Fe-S cluster assembly iron-binding protein IscA